MTSKYILYIIVIVAIAIISIIVQYFKNKELYEIRDGCMVFRYSSYLRWFFVLFYLPVFSSLIYFYFFYNQRQWLLLDYCQFFLMTFGLITIGALGYWDAQYFSIEMDDKKISVGMKNKNTIFFSDITEIRLMTGGRTGKGKRLVLINDEGKSVLDTTNNIQAFDQLVEFIKERAPKNKVKLRERDMWGKWKESWI